MAYAAAQRLTTQASPPVDGAPDNQSPLQLTCVAYHGECATAAASLATSLACVVCPRSRWRVSFEPLPSSERGGDAGKLPFRFADILILDRPRLDDMRWLRAVCDASDEPEVIVIRASSEVSAELAASPLPIAFELHGATSSDDLARACLAAVAIHKPMRRLCRQAVGTIALRDALTLVRLQMVREALRASTSKSGAARSLGVTRPAIQHILRSGTVAGASLLPPQVQRQTLALAKQSHGNRSEAQSLRPAIRNPSR